MSIPSVSGSEGRVGEFLESHLGSLGYKVERQNVTHDRFNVIAFAGQPHVMFCTHIDTVPPRIADPGRQRYLYGRGACDTKGIIAAMLEAGDRLRRNGTELRISLRCCRRDRQLGRQSRQYPEMGYGVRHRW